MMEMFMQGTEVSMAKASGGGRFVVWNHPLEELRACAASSVFKAKNELLGRGFLVELPGARVSETNGRLFSGWMTPVERPGEYTPNLYRTPENAPFSVSTPGASDSDEATENAPISVSTPEYTPISVGSESESPHVRARGGVHHHQRTTTTNNEISSPSLSPMPVTGEDGVDPRQAVALGGLRWAKYRDPEQALRRFGVERCLVAVQALAGKREANEYVGKPGGFVFSTLLALEHVEVAPVADLGFARWWDASALPGNVRVMREWPS